MGVKGMLRHVFIAALLLTAICHAAPPAFKLHDTTGAAHSPSDWAGQKAVLLYFVTIDCPVGNSYVPEMNRLREAYAARGVAFYAVQADPSVAELAVAKYARDYRYSFPLLMDPAQILVRHVNATITPQVAILTPDGKLQYLGPVDNRVEDFGQQRPQATERYVREVLDAILAGKPAPLASHKSIGCAIPRKQ